jgi:DNA-binding CsgD family transcriptional regulator
MIDLTRLNDSERRVLWMLGEGHTAKSIAIELGTSPAAINERLREARRKTGVGSSRELARLLKAQENRHEQIRVGRSPVPGATPSPSDAEPWRPHVGVFAMIALLLSLATGAAALMTQAPASKPEVDPLVGTLPSGPDPASLHARIRAERLDPTWAPRVQQALRARYAALEYVGAPIESLRVTCAATLCEVAGLIEAPSSKAEEQSLEAPLNRTMEALQGKALHDDLAKIGLEGMSGYFGGGKPGKMPFLQYWLRKDVKPK